MKILNIAKTFLVLAALSACATPDITLESSLTFPKARKILIDSANPARRAYAVRQLERLSLTGDDRATSNLAFGYLNGLNGIEVDPQQAIPYLDILRVNGNEQAQRILLRLYTTEESATYSPDAAIAVLTEALEAGDLAAGRRLANILDSQDRPDEAAQTRSRLIAQGSTAAQLDLAAAALTPTNPSYDPQRAISLYEELAVGNDPLAYRALGLVYLRGTDVERDVERAYTYFTQGYSAGDDFSGMQVGLSLLVGRGVDADPDQGLALLNELALNGVTGAWFQLAQRNPEQYALALQHVLRDEGVYQGPPTGEIDNLTLQALAQWCPDNNVPGDCTLEPLGRDLSIALARAARQT
ncbi:TPR repeat [Monaibacterium marinum]|uniref:TPR repeat n=2 Tax=Pontivivens marinum TaxID=1690039 RepID=A0A2C9CYC2_9RHOB|nr:TPR repeat [Monaibacterium marinum]